MSIHRQRYRETYWASLDAAKPFVAERPASFGPAAATQERQSKPFMLWKFISQWIPWQYTSFFDESESFHRTAYLGDWSPLPKLKVCGPDALKFLQYHTTNNLRKFNPGQIKHAIQVNGAGKVAGEGILYQQAELEYRYMGGAVYWLDHWLKKGDWDAEAEVYSPDDFVFVVQGPESIRVLERAVGENLRDIKFSYTRMSRLAGHDVRILRTGVSGELGYEIHGPVETADEIWQALTQAGLEFGLKLLGGRSQIVSHVEGCFPTIGREFLPAVPEAGKSRAHTIDLSGGSYEWSDPNELMRTPAELGWHKEVSLDTHDFMGRDALVAERLGGGPGRTITGLTWNVDDIVDVYSSLFREGDRYNFMELPRVSHKHAMEPDKVIDGGSVVGCSTSRVYSSALRRMISLCVMDSASIVPGKEVVVVWGDRHGPQKHIRALVTPLPFKPDRRRTDVGLLPETPQLVEPPHAR